MLLSNFWKFVFKPWSMNLDGSGYITVSCGQVNLNGNSFSSYQVERNHSNIWLQTAFKPFIPDSMRLRIGTGTTSPAIDDYCLANDVTSSFGFVRQNSSPVLDNKGISVYVTFSGINNSNSTLLITEAGLVLRASDLNYAEVPMLIARILLENQVSVEPGCIFSETIKFDLM